MNQARQAIIESILSEKNRWFVLSWDKKDRTKIIMYKSMKSLAPSKRMIPKELNPIVTICTNEEMRTILEENPEARPCVEWDFTAKNQPVPTEWTL